MTDIRCTDDEGRRFRDGVYVPLDASTLPAAAQETQFPRTVYLNAPNAMEELCASNAEHCRIVREVLAGLDERTGARAIDCLVNGRVCRTALWVIRPNGSVQHRVINADQIENPSWSPDAGRIVFSGLRSGLSDLFIYTVESGEVRQLTAPAFDRYWSSPRWSPQSSPSWQESSSVSASHRPRPRSSSPQSPCWRTPSPPVVVVRKSRRCGYCSSW